LRWRVEEVVLRPDRDVLVVQVGETDVQGRGTPASSYCVRLVLSLRRGGVRGPGLRLVGDALILEENLVLDLIILGKEPLSLFDNCMTDYLRCRQFHLA
jgi:hypothetical protein